MNIKCGKWVSSGKKTGALIALAAASSAIIMMTGCTLSGTAPATSEAVPLQIAGSLRGGQQPIAGATISLYGVGLTGYGSTATPEGSVTTDSNGNFNFGAANTCGTSTTLLLYVIASGGDSGTGSPNPNIKMASVVGPCSASKSTVTNIDEVSTVATVYALAQYFNPATENFGRSATYLTGIKNAFATAAVLADLTQGVANTSLTVGAAATQTTITPESSKLNLIANILASCINSDSTSSTTSENCATLFANAVPPPSGAVTALGSSATFPPATDTLMAAYYMAVNPINASTAGVPNPVAATALFGLATPTSPFGPALSSVPADWTIGINYTANFQLASTCYPVSGTTNPQIDTAGDIFFISHAGGQTQCETKLLATGAYSSSVPSSASLTPLSQAFTLDTVPHGFYVGTVAGGNEILGAALTGANYTPKNSGNGIAIAAMIADGVTGTATPADSDLLFLDAVNGNLFEIPNGSTASTSFAVSPINSSPLSLTGNGPNSMALDPSGNIWIAETGANSISSLKFPSANAPARLSSSTAFRNPLAVAVDHSNNLWVTNSVGGTDDGFITYVTTGTTPALFADTTDDDGGVNNPVSVAVDGAGNAWVANAGQTVGSTPNVGQTVSELYYTGSAIVPLSPSGAGGGFSHTYNGVSGIAIDGSGNVWITNSGAVASPTTSGLITEIVGAAVPAVAPLSTAIGSNKLGIKP